MSDIPTAEDLDVCRRYGLEIPPFVPERKYPVIHYWGIECWSGWLQIVFDAAIKMEALLHEMRASGVARDDLPGFYGRKLGTVNFWLLTKMKSRVRYE